MQRSEIEWMPIASIKPYDKNPRRNDDAVDAVANSITEFGFKNPIIVDNNLVIIAGHTRLKAAKNLGLKEVPVIIASDPTPEQVRAFRIIDNKTAELADWDEDLLKGEMQDLDIDWTEFGFDDVDLGIEDVPIEEMLDTIVEDEAPEPPEEPRTKRGDVYRLGSHYLMCGDSTSKEDVDRLMGGTKAEMLFTDPPWNVDYGETKEKWNDRRILNDNLSENDFYKFLSDVFTRAKESLVGGGITYVILGIEEWGTLMSVMSENGFHWSSTIIWAKDQFVLSRKDYHLQYEPMWYGWEGSKPRIHPVDDRTQSDLWEIERPKRSDEHPTMKPVKLVARAIVNSSCEGDTVLDLFGGSGSTLIACEQTGRKCRTMELDPGYCDVIIDRWESLTGEEAVLVS